MQTNPLYYSVTDFIAAVFTGADGKPMIARSTVIKMCREGKIPCTQLGMQRRYFIPATYVQSLITCNTLEVNHG